MFYRASSRSRCTILACATAVVPLLVACGGGEQGAADSADSPAAAVACPTPEDSIIGGALDKFLATRPVQAMRLLYAFGTDSAIPQASQYPAQDKGRVLFIWPPNDQAMQEKQKADLRAKGKMATMIVSYHGIQDEPGGKKGITFSGTYIDAANDGMTVPRTRITFDCTAPEGSRFTAPDSASAGAAPAGAQPGKAGD